MDLMKPPCYNKMSFSTAQSYESYVSSLPPAVRPHLEDLLDSDNDTDTDLREIAHHMVDWDSKLATYLNLTEVDISDTKRKHSMDPEVQR